MKSGSTPWCLRSVPVLLLLSLVALVPSSAFAQAVTGTIIGRITDTSGAVIPGVTVTLTNNGTQQARVVTTDTNGEYSAPSLPTGIYTVAAEISGFKTVTMSNVDLGVDQHVRLDVKLEVGNLTESVTIEARSPLVQTSSSELGTTV
ncbi:MAG TPA: carboxypeptidase-like regulatory domain-containing protein, partial [Vicinamibacterales bacterium]